MTQLCASTNSSNYTHALVVRGVRSTSQSAVQVENGKGRALLGITFCVLQFECTCLHEWNASSKQSEIGLQETT